MMIALLSLLVQVPTLPVGSKAPELDVPGVDGKRWTLKDFADKKLLLVVFDTTHCPTSQNYEERLKKIHEDYAGKGVGMIAISPNHPQSIRLDELGYTDLDDTFASMKIRARDHKIPYPFCFDGEPNQVSQAYGPKATPHCFLFDADRVLRYQGGVDDSEWTDRVKVNHLRNALDALLAGQEPPAKETKVFGCSTKWPSKLKQAEEYTARIQAEPVTVEEATAEAVAALRKPSTGVRLIHVWSPEKAGGLKSCTTMYHWYRRRLFEYVPIAVTGDKEAALAGLTSTPPAGKNRNLIATAEAAKGVDPSWDGALPLTLVLSATGEVLYRAQGEIDELACRRAIVRNLKEDRKR